MLLALLLAGVLHGLGPDHLAAITAFGAIAGNNFRKLMFFALRFAGGHAMVIAAAGILGHFGRRLLPPAWERAFDLLAGGLLMASGAVLLSLLLTRRLRLHAHEHPSGVLERGHFHFHLHLGDASRHQHSHGKLAWMVGGLFALGGARSLMVVVPVAVTVAAGVSLLRIAAFSAGIVIVMVGYAALCDRLAGSISSPSAVRGVSPWLASACAALFSLAAGMYTVISRLAA